MSDNVRQYIHGDQAEFDAGKYYCCPCDLFLAVGHFAGEPHANVIQRGRGKVKVKDTNYLRAERGLKYFPHGRSVWGACGNHGMAYRPDDAVNLFLDMA